MTFRVLIADSMAKEAVDVFEAAEGVEVTNSAGISKEDLIKAIPEYDGLAIRSRTNVDAEIIAAASRLKVIGRAGIGVDNVDRKAATRAGIVVMNMPDGNAVTTAEHTLALMMALARNVPQGTASMKAGRWEKKKLVGRELFRKTLGIIGLGNIGRIVADRAQGLRLKVVAFDPFLDAETAAGYGVDLVPLADLLRRADIITVHTPLSDQTRGLIGEAQIELMKPGVLLINCARGGIYDEAALLRGLEAGRIGGVALDVFSKEPPAADDPLVKHDRVICTPHLGASTSEAQIAVAVGIAEQIVELARGEPARNAVNLPRVDHKELQSVGPYLDLAQRMGSFSAQLLDGAIKETEVRLNGAAFAERTAAFVTTAAVAGVLQTAFDRPVNFVNARVLAEDRGLRVVESRSEKARGGFSSTIEVTVRGADGSHSVAGTIFPSGEGRFVEVDGVRIEAVPEGYLLHIHNYDRPGVIGHLGSVLGEAGVNIARMHLALERGSDKASSIVQVDKPVPQATLERLQTGHVISVRQVKL